MSNAITPLPDFIISSQLIGYLLVVSHMPERYALAQLLFLGYIKNTYIYLLKITIVFDRR